MNEDKPRVMLVDDEPNLLAGLRRQLGRRFDLTTREGGAEALATLRQDDDFAVIVADMRMPGMDGAQLLAEVARLHPAISRVMLTGNADQETAARAVNEGHVHRFLNKPIDPERLAGAIDGGVERWRAERAERRLLENTLAGTVKLLVDVLTSSHPESLNHIDTMRKVAAPLARRLCPAQSWIVDLGCLLSRMGLLLAPLERAGTTPDPAMTLAAAELLRRIPRLEPVADLLATTTGPDGAPATAEKGAETSRMGMAHLVYHFAHAVAAVHPGAASPLGPSVSLALTRQDWPSPLRDAAAILLDGAVVAKTEWREMALELARLQAGDVTRGDVRGADGVLLLSVGVPLTDVLIARLKSAHAARGVAQPITIARAVLQAQR